MESRHATVPSADSSLALLYFPNSQSERQAFLHTVEFFKEFSVRLAETNKECRTSLTQLKSKLDRLVQTFYDDTVLSTKKDLATARAKLWSIFGGNKDALSDATERASVVNRVGEGLQRLTSSTLFLDFHLQRLGVGANELAEHSERVTQSDTLPMMDIMNLVAGGCASLRETALGWYKHPAGAEAKLVDASKEKKVSV
ncbi:hypothetical protein CVT24_001849 [Panaeolus cyanescens]|uniref:Uncharacterized protein n=1 Tax=Panaeolus cyanescens TaxID=181874 RepID=A0A409YEU8_9AGAR|nr:hypothetical protein CVT24_001849 [Panaeolus cyanescens]